MKGDHGHQLSQQAEAYDLRLAEWSLVSVLEHVLKYLPAKDVPALRLTARAFRLHPAALNRCRSAKMRAEVSMEQMQASFCFLGQLANLIVLDIKSASSLYGVQQLRCLEHVAITACPKILDLFPLSLLPKLTSLGLRSCSTQQLGNMSELTRLTSLQIDREGFDQEACALTNLKHLDIDDISGGLGGTQYSPVFSTLTGLTFLGTNAADSQAWHMLAQLQTLDIKSGFPELGTVLALTGLRALGLDSVGDASLDPLSALAHLCRLDLTDNVSSIPELTALTRLSFKDLKVFPTMSGMSALQQLQLEPLGRVFLPHLAEQFPALSTISYDDADGELLMNISDNGIFTIVRVIAVLALDEPIMS